ncbi:MAG: hypothetical protein ACOYLU_15100, partial [Limisphaerales bacterium]
MMDVPALRSFLDACLSSEFGESSVAGGNGKPTEAPYEYEIDDLFHLYSTVRKASCVSVLEFGSGWSTLVLALGLHENAEVFGAEHLRSVRHPNPFQLL